MFPHQFCFLNALARDRLCGSHSALSPVTLPGLVISLQSAGTNPGEEAGEFVTTSGDKVGWSHDSG